jgi:methionyl-tRNA formyltransferase
MAEPSAQHNIRIAYVGLPLGAWLLARAGFAPGLICLGHLDTPGARRVRRQLGTRALVLAQPDLRAASVVSCLASFAPDVLLSWFWPKQIPAEVLALPRLGAYGVHPSLLPRWRGPDPYFWTLHAGDVETGVSLHVLEAEYDTGPVVAQRRLRVEPRDNAWTLARRLDRPGLGLLVDAARELSSGQPLRAQPQPSVGMSDAPAPTDEQLSIDWHDSAEQILRLVRAAAPYPGAGAALGETWVELLEAEASPVTLPAALEPAEAVVVGESVAVQTGAGAVLLKRVRNEAGEVLVGGAIASLFDHGLARF